jgi:hypothetical protein
VQVCGVVLHQGHKELPPAGGIRVALHHHISEIRGKIGLTGQESSIRSLFDHEADGSMDAVEHLIGRTSWRHSSPVGVDRNGDWGVTTVVVDKVNESTVAFEEELLAFVPVSPSIELILVTGVDCWRLHVTVTAGFTISTLQGKPREPERG